MTIINDTVYSYEDIKDLFARAMSSDRGIKVKLASRGKAKALAQKFNTYRSRQRKHNATIYDPDHPLCGHSIYDAIEVSVKETAEGLGEVHLIRSSGEHYDVEDL